MNRDHQRIRQQAMRWIRGAGDLAWARFGTATVSRKEDRSPVTDVDHAVQDALLDAIAREFPADAVITEETQSTPGAHPPVAEASRCWVVDPIDGTRNYARGFPVFAVSVALMEAGRPVVGFVYDPVNGRMFSAAAGSGAWVDEQPLVPAHRPPSGSLFISIPTSEYEGLPPVVHGWIDRMVIRNLGSTALHLVLLAAGALDAVYCRKSKLWDIAAGAVIAGQTGAKILSHEGQPYFPMNLAGYANEPMPFIAGRPAVLNRLVAEYRQAEESAT